MDLPSARMIFYELYEEVSGLLIGNQERTELIAAQSSHSLTYGETLPRSFQRLLNETHPEPGEEFWDLGCGTGKPVMLAALLFPFARLYGVELVTSTVEAAQQILARYDAELRPGLAPLHQEQEIRFIAGDMLQVDLSRAGVVFAYSTCFSDALMKLLEEKLREVPKGCRIALVSKTLDGPEFKKLAQVETHVGFGLTECSIYLRT